MQEQIGPGINTSLSLLRELALHVQLRRFEMSRLSSSCSVLSQNWRTRLIRWSALSTVIMLLCAIPIHHQIQLVLQNRYKRSIMERDNSSVKAEPFGLDGEAQLFTLCKGAMQLSVTNWGATITSLLVPDAAGKVADVVLGFDTLTPYMDGTSPYFGSIVGRVANRIADASFTLEGQTYKLVPTSSNPEITLHGGKKGFDKVLWKIKNVEDGPNPSVQFIYQSSDGEQGFPGDVDVSVTYTLSGNLELRTEMEAVPRNKPSPISLAQHSYWNLAGHESGDILGHIVRIWASHITPVDEQLIPTGEYVPVEGTPFDFRHPSVINKRIHEVPGGYDHNFVLDKKDEAEGELHLAARVKDPTSGRVMDLLTNAPGLQFYTGNFVSKMTGKGGSQYDKHSGLCFETQGFPNSVNQPKFPSIIYAPGQVYKHTMLHRFYTDGNKGESAIKE